MTEPDHDRIVRLEERQDASEKALALALDTVKEATNNSYSLVSLIASILAILVAVYSIFHHP